MEQQDELEQAVAELLRIADELAESVPRGIGGKIRECVGEMLEACERAGKGGRVQPPQKMIDFL